MIDLRAYVKAKITSDPTLNGLLAGRVFSKLASNTLAVYPYIIMSQGVAKYDKLLSGVTTTTYSSFDINILSNSQAEAVSIAKSLTTLFSSVTSETSGTTTILWMSVTDCSPIDLDDGSGEENLPPGAVNLTMTIKHIF